MMRTAYELRAADDDWSQAGAMVLDVWNDAQRDRFVHTVAGHLLNGVRGEVLERAFRYWQNVDPDTGKRIEELVRDAGGSRGSEPTGTGDVRDARTFAAH
jgi:catalase